MTVLWLVDSSLPGSTARGISQARTSPLNQPWVYMCSPSWPSLPPPSPSHLSGSSQCTSPEHPASCIEPGLAISFTYDNIHVSMLFSHVNIWQKPPQYCKVISLQLKLKKIPHWNRFAISFSRGSSWPQGSNPCLLHRQVGSLPLSYLGNLFKMFATAAAKSLQSCLTLCDPIDGSPPGSPVPGILQARTLAWVAFPSPMHENEKWKWSLSVLSNSESARLLCPWDFPGKSTGVGCHCLLRWNV